MKCAFAVFMVVGSFALCGCRTPTAVKRLSAEQVKVQASFEQSLRAQFVIIEKMAANQVAASTFLIDQSTGEIIDKEKLKALRDLNAADSAARQKVVDSLTRRTQEELDAAAKSKAQIADLVQKLKSKDSDLLNAYSAIRTAQEKLDTFIQLKKADETVVNELIAVVGVNRERIERTSDDIAALVDKLTTVLKP